MGVARWGLTAVPLVLCAVLALIACDDGPPPTRFYNVGLVGDSYTGGSSMGGVEQAGWPAQMCRSLLAENIDVTEKLAPEGKAGYVQHGTRGGVFIDQVPKATSNAPQLIVFFGSRNDLHEPVDQVGAAATEAWAMAARIAPDATILVIGPAWSDGNPPAELFPIRDELRYAASLNGHQFVDPLAERWFADEPNLIGTDGIHPTDDGHTYLAEKIRPFVEAALSAKPGNIDTKNEESQQRSTCGRAPTPS